MENFDFLGIYIGDLIVVVFSQILSDEEYYMFCFVVIKIVCYLGVVGECNVQYVFQFDGLDYRVIEVNVCFFCLFVLVFKVIGYLLVYIVVKIGFGYIFFEFFNVVIKIIIVNFEFLFDYIVIKIFCWDLFKFQYVKCDIGSVMKFVGEVMVIGCIFEEFFQKVIRQVDFNFVGFQGVKFEDFEFEFQNLIDCCWLVVGQVMFYENYIVDCVYELIKIDKWFLYKFQNIVDCIKEFQQIGSF